MDADSFWEEKILRDDNSCKLMERMFGAEGLVDKDGAKAAEIERTRALAEIGMENWTSAQMIEWIMLLDLDPDVEDVVEDVLTRLSSAEVKELSDPKILGKMLRKHCSSGGAPPGGWGSVASQLVQMRDQMVYMSEHLEEFASGNATSSDDVMQMFDQLVRGMDEKDISSVWSAGGIPMDKVASVWGLGSRWAKRAQMGGRKFNLARQQRKQREEAEIKDLISTQMERWSSEQVMEWCGLIGLNTPDATIVRAALAESGFDGKVLKAFHQTDQLATILRNHGAQGLGALSLAENVLEKRDEAIGAREKLISISFESDLPVDKSQDLKASFCRMMGNRFGESGA
jgi:hypothetical protein